MQESLIEKFGNIDIYVFDQLLKGNIAKTHRILDAGCGGGRNHYYLAKNNFNLSAFDIDEERLRMAKEQATLLGYNHTDKFVQGNMVAIPFKDESFDWIINVAVLHFAEEKSHFEQMLNELWRVLAKGGKLLIRVASNIGIAHLMQPLRNNRFVMPDGSERFVLDEKDFDFYTKKLDAIQFEPLKTTNVSNLRCMTTWCLQKPVG